MKRAQIPLNVPVLDPMYRLALTESALRCVEASCLAAREFYRERVASCQASVDYWKGQERCEPERKVAAENLMYFKSKSAEAERAVKAIMGATPVRLPS